jgi:hypothetical protein
MNNLTSAAGKGTEKVRIGPVFSWSYTPPVFFSQQNLIA